MPESLPSKAKKLWEQVYNAAKADGDDEEKAAKKAYGALKKAGWSKDENGKWTKKSQLSELSLTIKRASFDQETGEKRWRAETSDTGEDAYGDSMTLDLFQDFVSRIESEQEAPYRTTSGFWKGGMPYLSISHYPDYNGKGVPGEVKSVYIDGSFLKAKGVFNDDKLGNACWEAIKRDLEEEKIDDKIRISIGFLDYAHKHKSTGYTFERKTLDDMCPECFMAMFTGDNAEKEYLKGQLVHLALTRIPANKRTDINPDFMEERSMATRKEDAASIVGEEVAEELESLEVAIPEVEKALVVKSEDEEVEAEPETIEEDGAIGGGDVLAELKSEIEELKSMFAPAEVEDVAHDEHVLSDAFATFRSDFDVIANSEAPAEEKLRQIQEPYNALGQEIISVIRGVEQEQDVEERTEQQELIRAFSEALAPIGQKLDLLLTKQSDYTNPNQPPARRSFNPVDIANMPKQSNKPLSINDIARRSVGLEN